MPEPASRAPEVRSDQENQNGGEHGNGKGHLVEGNPGSGSLVDVGDEGPPQPVKRSPGAQGYEEEQRYDPQEPPDEPAPRPLPCCAEHGQGDHGKAQILTVELDGVRTPVVAGGG